MQIAPAGPQPEWPVALQCQPSQRLISAFDGVGTDCYLSGLQRSNGDIVASIVFSYQIQTMAIGAAWVVYFQVEG